MPRYVLTGAPGTGKSTVLGLLGERFDTVPEPARRVIAEHSAATGEKTLDHRPALLVEKLIERSIDDYSRASETEITFFDRGLPDCVAYAEVSGLDSGPVLEVAAGYRYESPVFMARPWREIYTTDDLRRATFEQVEAFHASLIDVYRRLEYEMVELPDVSPAARAGLILKHVGHPDDG